MELQSKYHDDDDDDIDPMYKIFLEHLREDGTSYVLDMVDEDDDSLILVKYEDDHELPETRDGAGFSCKNYQTSEHGSGIASSEPIQNASQVSESQIENSVDHNYQRFLNHIKLQDGRVVLEWKPEVVVRYEEKTSAHSVGLSSYRTPSCGGKRSIPYESATQHSDSQSESEEEDNGCFLTDVNDDSQHYEKKLMNVLSKPYDQNEYEELLKLATEHKPSVKLRHLRSDSVSYVTKKKGMAYLDHHPDLAAQIKKSDCRTALKLLRGFFFWLKHLSHEGAYPPWTSRLSSSKKSSPLDI